jgi:hypothetical protein
MSMQKKSRFTAIVAGILVWFVSLNVFALNPLPAQWEIVMGGCPVSTFRVFDRKTCQAAGAEAFNIVAQCRPGSTFNSRATVGSAGIGANWRRNYDRRLAIATGPDGSP